MEKSKIIPAANRLIARNPQLLMPSRWKTLTKANKRRAVLLDAMKQLIAGLYVPISQYRSTKLMHGPKTRQLQEVLLMEDKKCDVCQRGMLLLSCVRFNDNVTVNDYFESFESAEFKAGLDDLFSHRERINMEHAFESHSSFFAALYGFSDADRTVRAVAIFLNAYKFGVFTPEKFREYASTGV